MVGTRVKAPKPQKYVRLFPDQLNAQQYTVEVYVPSTRNASVPISKAVFKRRVAETESFVDRLYGGSTELSGIGSWVEPKTGHLIKERVTIVSSTADPVRFLKYDANLKKFLMRKKRQWGQKTIAVEVNGHLYFV